MSSRWGFLGQGRALALAAATLVLGGLSVVAVPPGRAATAAATVTVTILPAGSGSVRDSAGNSCSPGVGAVSTCVFSYGPGSTTFEQNITYAASPASGMAFAAWSARGYNSTCSGLGSPPGSCTLAIRGDSLKPVSYAVTATFAPSPSPTPTPPTPTPTPSPAGSLPPSPLGASPSTSVRPSPTPSRGVRPAPVQATLSVSVRGNGTVTSEPAGIDCGGGQPACSSSFPAGTTVQLTATPSTGAVLGAWGGACTGSAVSGTACSLAMATSIGASASFVAAASSPQASFTAPMGAEAIGPSVFVPKPAPGTTPTSYGWDFESTGDVASCPASAPVALHAFTRGGTFTVTLQMQEASGASVVTTQTVVVSGKAQPSPLIAPPSQANLACAPTPPGFLPGAQLTPAAAAALCVTSLKFDYSTVATVDPGQCFSLIELKPVQHANVPLAGPSLLSGSGTLPPLIGGSPPTGLEPALVVPETLGASLDAAGNQSTTSIDPGCPTTSAPGRTPCGRP